MCSITVCVMNSTFSKGCLLSAILSGMEKPIVFYLFSARATDLCPVPLCTVARSGDTVQVHGPIMATAWSQSFVCVSKSSRASDESVLERRGSGTLGGDSWCEALTCRPSNVSLRFFLKPFSDPKSIRKHAVSSQDDVFWNSLQAKLWFQTFPPPKNTCHSTSDEAFCRVLSALFLFFQACFWSIANSQWPFSSTGKK